MENLFFVFIARWFLDYNEFASVAYVVLACLNKLKTHIVLHIYLK